MSINIQDPLFLLTQQTGLSVSELASGPAVGNPDINATQEVLKTGEPIPILFARFRNGAGGVMVQPKMTEASFSNDIDEEIYQVDGGSTLVRPYSIVRVKFLLVLSEGNMPLVQIRDIFYGSNRRGSFDQAYNARAGLWTPGNFWDNYLGLALTTNSSGHYEVNWSNIGSGQGRRGGDFIYYKDSRQEQHVLPYIENNFPVFCGTSGSYSGLTTLSFQYTAEQQSSSTSDVLKGINLFVRNGLQVTRLVDGVTAESDNFADLVKYLLTASDRLADDLVDNTSLTISANFTDTNGFLFNGHITESANLLDWIQAASKNYLLRLSMIDGKIGLLPRLPYNTDYTIKTTKVAVEFTFTEKHVVQDGFEIQYISLEDREPACFNIQWRQQPEADFGLVRTAAIRYTGEAQDGPFIDIDMSSYCTSEDHAVKVGTFYLARRKFITHHLRLTVRERSYNTSLVVGDIVRVRLRRESDEGEVQYHDKVYEINRIEKGFDSAIVYDLTHFPVDDTGASIVAQEVDAASGSGNVIDVGRSDFDGDENSSTSTATVGTNSGGGGSNQPGIGDTEYEFDPGDYEDTPYPEGEDNPDDDLDGEASVVITGYDSGSGVDAGDTLEFSPGCANPKITWYSVDPVTGEKKIIKGPGVGTTLDVVEALEAGATMVYAEGCCPDPSTPSGYGPCVDSDELDLSDIVDEIEECPGGGDAGGQGGSTKVIDVGTAYPASFTFTWTAYAIQDRFIISGAATYDTGFVSGTNISVTVQKTSASRYITVQVQAPTQGTAWNYQVGCAS